MPRSPIRSEAPLLAAALLGLALGAALALLPWRDAGSIGSVALGIAAAASLAAAIHFGMRARRSERALQRLRVEHVQELADAERVRCELEALNASMSHDLRSPLGAIVNFAAILDEHSADRLGEHGRDQLRRIGESASAAVAILDAASAHLRRHREATLRPTSASSHRVIEIS